MVSRTNRIDMPYRRKDCRNWFSLKTETSMANSKLPLEKWLLAFYLDLANLKGVSSMKLCRDFDLSQISAWFTLQRVREAFMTDEPPPDFALGGEFQLDAAYFGGLEANRHFIDRIPGGQGGANMMDVISITQVASGKMWVDIIPDTGADTIADTVERIVPMGATLYTDDGRHYRRIQRERHPVNHNLGEYVRIVDLANGMQRMATTNTVESGWSMFRRSYHGIHHKMSPKHPRRYAKTFLGRWNIRLLDTEEQMRHVIREMVGRELSYDMLTEDNGFPSGAGPNGAHYPERRIRYNGELDDYILQG